LDIHSFSDAMKLAREGICCYGKISAWSRDCREEWDFEFRPVQPFDDRDQTFSFDITNGADHFTAKFLLKKVRATHPSYHRATICPRCHRRLDGQWRIECALGLGWGCDTKCLGVQENDELSRAQGYMRTHRRSPIPSASNRKEDSLFEVMVIGRTAFFQ